MSDDDHGLNTPLVLCSNDELVDELNQRYADTKGAWLAMVRGEPAEHPMTWKGEVTVIGPPWVACFAALRLLILVTLASLKQLTTWSSA